MTGKLGIISAAVATLTLAVAAVYWFSDTGQSLSIAGDLLVKATEVLWIFGVGFTIASGLAVLAIARGEPRALPFGVITADILGFVFMILAIALS